MITEVAKGTWFGSFEGSGELRLGNAVLPVTLPREMKGTGHGANPEQLLAGASLSCLMITLGIIFDKNGVRYQGIEGRCEASLSTALPPTLEALNLTIHVASSESRDKITPLVERAKAMCVIGRALNSSIAVTLSITVGQEKLASTYPKEKFHEVPLVV